MSCSFKLHFISVSQVAELGLSLRLANELIQRGLCFCVFMLIQVYEYHAGHSWYRSNFSLLLCHEYHQWYTQLEYLKIISYSFPYNKFNKFWNKLFYVLFLAATVPINTYRGYTCTVICLYPVIQNQVPSLKHFKFLDSKKSKTQIYS